MMESDPLFKATESSKLLRMPLMTLVSSVLVAAVSWA